MAEKNDEDNSFMKNLRGILSPKQFKKIKIFLEDESFFKRNIDFENDCK